MVLWGVFGVVVLALLALDLGVFHRKDREVGFREAIAWTSVWVTLALFFNAFIYFYKGPESALEFFTAYLMEKSLSVDNIFVFSLIFTYFKIPAMYQYRALVWGVLGALVMRAIFITVGLWFIEAVHWVVYLFGFFLVITGIRLGLGKNKEIHPEKNPILILFEKLMPVTRGTGAGRFLIRENGKLYATNLFVVIIVIETTDLVFALDSIPAVIAISQDPLIVYTSNIFAIMGLRSLYFTLSNMMKMFHWLHYGLAIILVFVGVKMLLSPLMEISTVFSLVFITSVIALSVLLSKHIKQ